MSKISLKNILKKTFKKKTKPKVKKKPIKKNKKIKIIKVKKAKKISKIPKKVGKKSKQKTEIQNENLRIPKSNEIKPDECIDCGVCEPECPVDAIKADIEPGSEKWLEINKKYSEIWPNISEKKDPPSDHEKYKNEQNKFEKYFKENL